MCHAHARSLKTLIPTQWRNHVFYGVPECRKNLLTGLASLLNMLEQELLSWPWLPLSLWELFIHIPNIQYWQPLTVTGCCCARSETEGGSNGGNVQLVYRWRRCGVIA